MYIIILGLKKFDCLEWNLNETLKKHGYKSDIIDPFEKIPFKIRFVFQKNLRSIEYLERFYWNNVLKKMIKLKIDLIISTVQDIPPSVIDNIKNNFNIPAIQWNPDSFNSLIWNRERIIQGNYDLWIYEDPYFERIFKMFSLPSLYIPEGFNPDIHKPLYIPKSEAEKDGHDIVIAGTLYPYRARILEELLEYDIAIYGPYPFWMKSRALKFHKKKIIAGLEKSEIFYKSKICLNTFTYTNITGTNCRLFEIAGSGGFQISEYRDEIPKFFEPNKEIVLFRTIDELKEKINYYLKHPEERWKIAEAGYKRAIKENTWEHRVKYLLKELNKLGLIKNEKY